VSPTLTPAVCGEGERTSGSETRWKGSEGEKKARRSTVVAVALRTHGDELAVRALAPARTHGHHLRLVDLLVS